MRRVHRHRGIQDCTYIPGPGLLARLAVWLRGRRDHRPRALALVLALPPAPPTLLEQVTCAPRKAPVPMPIPGPGCPQKR